MQKHQDDDVISELYENILQKFAKVAKAVVPANNQIINEPAGKTDIAVPPKEEPTQDVQPVVAAAIKITPAADSMTSIFTRQAFGVTVKVGMSEGQACVCVCSPQGQITLQGCPQEMSKLFTDISFAITDAKSINAPSIKSMYPM